MPAPQSLTGGKLLFSHCNPFSAFYAFSGAAAPSNALAREWWGFAPHPTFFCAKRKRKAFFRASRGSRRRAYPPDKFQLIILQ